MIFLDTNILLRALIGPESDNQRTQCDQAAALLRQIDAEVELATTSELVIHQTLFFMTEKRWYAIPLEDATQAIRSVLNLRGMRMSADDRAILIEAMEIWNRTPTLGMADSLILARSLRYEYDLATFDKALLRYPEMRLWNFGS